MSPWADDDNVSSDVLPFEYAPVARERSEIERVRGRGAFRLIYGTAHLDNGNASAPGDASGGQHEVRKVGEAGRLPLGVARAGRAVSVHWHAGLRNIILGTTKRLRDHGLPAVSSLRASRRASVDVPGALGRFAVCSDRRRTFAVVAIVLPMMAQAGAAMKVVVRRSTQRRSR